MVALHWLIVGVVVMAETILWANFHGRVSVVRYASPLRSQEAREGRGSVEPIRRAVPMYDALAVWGRRIRASTRPSVEMAVRGARRRVLISFAAVRRPAALHNSCKGPRYPLVTNCDCCGSVSPGGMSLAGGRNRRNLTSGRASDTKAR